MSNSLTPVNLNLVPFKNSWWTLIINGIHANKVKLFNQCFSFIQVCSILGNTIIDQAFAGYNTTLFTYGAKGSGKTTVLFGNKEERGIISFTLNNLFAAADKCDSDTSFRCEIRFVVFSRTFSPIILLSEQFQKQSVAPTRVKSNFNYTPSVSSQIENEESLRMPKARTPQYQNVILL